MAKSSTASSTIQSAKQIAQDEKKRIADLRKLIRDTNKEIGQLESTARREEHMAEWKMVSDLKQKFIKELREHPKLKRMSWNRFCKTNDYFIYARNVGQYTHYAVDDTAPWVKAAVKSGITLVELETNAKRMREGRWNREQARIRAKERAERKAEKDKAEAAGKSATTTDNTGGGKTDLEKFLGNG